jgi:hypothetical protein
MPDLGGVQKPSIEEMMGMLKEDAARQADYIADYIKEVTKKPSEMSESDKEAEDEEVEKLRIREERLSKEKIFGKTIKEQFISEFGKPNEQGLFDIKNGLLEAHSVIDEGAYVRTLKKFDNDYLKSIDSSTLEKAVRDGSINISVLNQLVGADAKGLIKFDDESRKKAVDVLLAIYQGPLDEKLPGMTIRQARDLINDSGSLNMIENKKEKEQDLTRIRSISDLYKKGGIDSLRDGLEKKEISLTDLQRLVVAADKESGVDYLGGSIQKEEFKDDKKVFKLSDEQKKEIIDLISNLPDLIPGKYQPILNDANIDPSLITKYN